MSDISKVKWEIKKDNSTGGAKFDGYQKAEIESSHNNGFAVLVFKNGFKVPKPLAKGETIVLELFKEEVLIELKPESHLIAGKASGTITGLPLPDDSR